MKWNKEQKQDICPICNLTEPTTIHFTIQSKYKEELKICTDCSINETFFTSDAPQYLYDEATSAGFDKWAEVLMKWKETSQ